MNPAENYILNQPEPFRNMLMHLQAVIERTVPNAQLKFKWKIPCYYLKDSPFCYLNVPAKKGYVDVGFWRSAHITKHADKMTTKGRKMIKSLRYTCLEEIDETVLKEILLDAYAVRDKKFWS
ncbi:DUF1801 domain-containing protein [Maribacter chungangensis]|uniref:DUF1801 domain-containing protein n=1 Tax=Maribacter chungangensis TaxID=1069117 RepID=A0ABW3B0W6_9FLAO